MREKAAFIIASVCMLAGLAVVVLSNSKQCFTPLQTLYIPYNGTASVNCTTERSFPSHWTYTKFDFDGNVVKRETLPPTHQNGAVLTCAVSEPGVYELSQHVPIASVICLCRFEVKVNVSAALQLLILADLDRRYGKLNLPAVIYQYVFSRVYTMRRGTKCDRF